MATLALATEAMSAAGWAAVCSAVIAFGAMVVAISQARAAKDQADAAKRQADAAVRQVELLEEQDRRAIIADQRAEIEATAARQREVERVASATLEITGPVNTSTGPALEIENTGRATATDVTIEFRATSSDRSVHHVHTVGGHASRNFGDFKPGETRYLAIDAYHPDDYPITFRLHWTDKRGPQHDDSDRTVTWTL